MSARTRLLGLLAIAHVALAQTAAADDSQRSEPAQDEADACANAFEAAQLHRRELRWNRARQELATCKAQCPAELSADCVRWETELSEERPVVSLSARDDRGQTLKDVRVHVDGATTAVATEQPLALDPGRHVLRFVHPDRRTIEQSVSLKPSERRAVVVVFGAPARLEPAAAEDQGDAVLPWVLAGVGTVGVGVGIGLGIKGRLDLNQLEEDCSPRCSEEQADGVRRTWVAGAVVGAAGGALLLTSLVLMVSTDGADEAGARLSGAPAGLGPGMHWTF
jgi:hypothetical protein